MTTIETFEFLYFVDKCPLFFFTRFVFHLDYLSSNCVNLGNDKRCKIRTVNTPNLQSSGICYSKNQSNLYFSIQKQRLYEEGNTKGIDSSLRCMREITKIERNE